MRSIVLGRAILILGALLMSCGRSPCETPLSPQDLARMATPSGTAISPDGERVAYSLIAPDSTGRNYSESLWVVSVRGGDPVRLADRGSTPRWSPGGDRIAYLSSAGAENHQVQLRVVPVSGGTPESLTHTATSITDFAWSPDGSRIAFTAAADSEAVSEDIHLLEVATGTVRRITHLDRTLIVHFWDPDANLSWSPDGRQLAFSVKPTPRFDDDFQSDIYAVEVGTGEVRGLVQRPGMDMRPLWSPDGSQIAFRSSFGAVDRFADQGIAFVPAAGGPVRDAGKAFAGGYLDGPYQYAWAPDGRTLYFTGADSLSTSILAIDAASGRITRLSRRPAQRAGLSVATRAGRLAFVMSDATTPWEVYTADPEVPSPRRLTRSNPYMEARALGIEEAVRWTSGTWTLDGVLVRPPGSDRGTPLPLVVILHGGPEGSARLGFEPELPQPAFNYDGGPHPAQLYASEGYAVFFPNFRGSGGHGSALRRAGSVNWSEAFFEDVMTGVDALIQRGIADSSRMFLVGSRSGATKVVSVLTRTNRFRAAYVHNPYPDLVAEYEAGGDFRLMYLGMFGALLESAPELYARESPINAADRIATPLQIAADDDAFLIPSSQSLALHRKLAERYVPGELMLFRGRDIPATIELLRRNLAWLDRWNGSD